MTPGETQSSPTGPPSNESSSTSTSTARAYATASNPADFGRPFARSLDVDNLDALGFTPDGELDDSIQALQLQIDEYVKVTREATADLRRRMSALVDERERRSTRAKMEWTIDRALEEERKADAFSSLIPAGW